MRARATLLLLACPCFIQALNFRATREKHDFSDQNVFDSVVPCVFKLGLAKCVGAFGAWRAEKALEGEKFIKTAFPWQSFLNISDEEIYSDLCDRTERLLERRSLGMNLNQDYGLQLVAGNGSLRVDVVKNNNEENGRGSMKKLEKHFYNLVPFLLMPGLIMSAVLPFMLPSLKMMTIAAGMLNNMALTGAVFTLLRNNAFNDKYHKKVIYINDGYTNDGLFNDKYEPFADTPSEVVVDPSLDSKFQGLESHDFKDFHQGPVIIRNGEPDYQMSSDWLQKLTGNRNVKILNNVFDQSDWRKRDTAQEKFQNNEVKKEQILV